MFVDIDSGEIRVVQVANFSVETLPSAALQGSEVRDGRRTV